MSAPATPNSTFWPEQTKTVRGEGLRRIAGWASVAMFLVWIGFSGLALVWNLEQRSLLHRAQAHPFSVSIDEVRDADARADFLKHTVLVLMVVTAVFFITWLYLEYRRVRRYAPTRFDAGWAIGGWFVPFLNWFRPYQVVEDVWGATAGRTRSRALVGAWWGCYLASGLVAVAAGSGEEAKTFDEALSHNGLYIARAVLMLAAAVFAALLVRSVLHASVNELPSGAESQA